MVLTDMQALHLLADTAEHEQYVTAEQGWVSAVQVCSA